MPYLIQVFELNYGPLFTRDQRDSRKTAFDLAVAINPSWADILVASTGRAPRRQRGQAQPPLLDRFLARLQASLPEGFEIDRTKVRPFDPTRKPKNRTL